MATQSIPAGLVTGKKQVEIIEMPMAVSHSPSGI